MTSRNFEYTWHEFRWQDVPEMPPGPHKKIKFYADANIPQPIINELRATGIVVKSAVEEGLATKPDQDIYQRAKKRGMVLPTMDGDFWDDNKYSLQIQKNPGVIFVDIPPGEIEKAIGGLARFYALFAKYYPLDYWTNIKVRVTEFGFTIKMRTWRGKIEQEEFRIDENGKLLTRKIR